MIDSLTRIDFGAQERIARLERRVWDLETERTLRRISEMFNKQLRLMFFCWATLFAAIVSLYFQALKHR